MNKNYYVQKITGFFLLFCILFCSLDECAFASQNKNVILHDFSKTEKSSVKNTNEIRVLLIGNSLTKRNHSAQMLKSMLDDAGYQAEVSTVLKGGARLKYFLNKKNPDGKKLRFLLNNKKWDYIVLQDASRAVFNKKFNMMEYFKEFQKLTLDSGAQIVLFMTWAFEEGCPLYKNKKFPSTPSEYLEKVSQKYEELRKEMNALLAPVGHSFYHFQESYPRIGIYKMDGLHPNEKGSYLSACTIFMTITGKSPEKLKYRGNLDENTAKKLRKTAYMTCINQKMKDMNQEFQ